MRREINFQIDFRRNKMEATEPPHLIIFFSIVISLDRFRPLQMIVYPELIAAKEYLLRMII